MDEVRESLNQVQDKVPEIIGALAILIIGWIVAAILGRVVTAAIRRTGLDDRVNEKMGGGQEGGQQTDVAELAGRIVYYIILLIVLVAALDALGLTVVTQPLNEILDGILGFLPNLIGAAILALVAWIVATIVRAVVTGGLQAMRFDERVGSQEGGETAPASESGTTPPVSGGEARTSLSSSIGEAAYWLIWLLFLPMILGALELTGLLEPVQELLNKFLGFLPNLAAAALIAVVGWFVAKIVARVVTNLLAAAGADRLGERIGLEAGGPRLSGIVGTIVFALILLPVITAALDALQLTAVTEPVSNLLDTILAAIPNILVAALILIFAVVIGRILAGLVTDILTGVGFNALPARLGFGEGAIGGRTPSGLIGLVVEVAIIWFGIIQALQALQFEQLTELSTELIELAGHILLGLIIFLVGLFLARLAAAAIRGSGVTNSALLAFAAQAAILVLAGGMALRQMGVADEIINLAFALLVGAIAVALAIAFGVGGRQVAGQELQRWVTALHTGQAEQSAELAQGGQQGGAQGGQQGGQSSRPSRQSPQQPGT